MDNNLTEKEGSKVKTQIEVPTNDQLAWALEVLGARVASPQTLRENEGYEKFAASLFEDYKKLTGRPFRPDPNAMFIRATSDRLTMRARTMLTTLSLKKLLEEPELLMTIAAAQSVDGGRGLLQYYHVVNPPDYNKEYFLYILRLPVNPEGDYSHYLTPKSDRVSSNVMVKSTNSRPDVLEIEHRTVFDKADFEPAIDRTIQVASRIFHQLDSQGLIKHYPIPSQPIPVK